jgi:hypothetical protein
VRSYLKFITQDFAKHQKKRNGWLGRDRDARYGYIQCRSAGGSPAFRCTNDKSARFEHANLTKQQALEDLDRALPNFHVSNTGSNPLRAPDKSTLFGRLSDSSRVTGRAVDQHAERRLGRVSCLSWPWDLHHYSSEPPPVKFWKVLDTRASSAIAFNCSK